MARLRQPPSPPPLLRPRAAASSPRPSGPGSSRLTDTTSSPHATRVRSTLVVVCFTVMGGTARAHGTPAPERARVWPFEMKGTKRKQKSEQPNHSPGSQGHTKRSREPAIKQESIQCGPKCGFTSSRWIHPLLHLKVRHVGHGICPLKQANLPASYRGVACALKNKRCSSLRRPCWQTTQTLLAQGTPENRLSLWPACALPYVAAPLFARLLRS